MQEEHSLFKMFAGTNSRGNANKSLNQCQNLNNCTPTPPLTQQQSTDDKLGVHVGLGEGQVWSCSDSSIYPNFHQHFPFNQFLSLVLLLLFQYLSVQQKRICPKNAFLGGFVCTVLQYLSTQTCTQLNSPLTNILVTMEIAQSIYSQA